jgi:DNA-binding transcriptional ArsR family regulator
LPISAGLINAGAGAASWAETTAPHARTTAINGDVAELHRRGVRRDGMPNDTTANARGVAPLAGLRNTLYREIGPRTSLDNKSCQYYPLLVLDIHVIDDPAAATVALEPTRSRLLSELVVPASAATLAARVGLARQKVNYHLRALEAHGLVRLAEERKWGGLTERLLVATAASYVVSPSALGPIAADRNREIDRLSASYLIALGARVVREVGDLGRRAKEAGKRLATLAVDTEVRFRSATDRAAFTNELTEAITKLVSKYHDASAPGGRAHRLVVVAHPLPQKSNPKEPS